MFMNAKLFGLLMYMYAIVHHFQLYFSSKAMVSAPIHAILT